MRISREIFFLKVIKAIALLVFLSFGFHDLIYAQEDVKKSTAVGDQDKTGLHLVKAKETFYSLSKLYNCTISDIKELNPGMLYPKEGEYIKVPGGETEIVREKIKSVPDEESVLLSGTYNTAKQYRVVLMIPLRLEDVQTMGPVETSNPLDWKNHPSFRYIQFYQGFMMAADSLKQKGLKVQIDVFDVGQELSKAVSAVEDPDFAKADLIIGPFFKNTFEYVASFAKRYEIPIINPLTQRDDIIQDNEFVVKLLPSRKGQAMELAKLVKLEFQGYEIILVSGNKMQNAEELSGLKDAIAEINPHLKIKEIDYSTDNINGIIDAASIIKPNLIIIYSEGEVLATEVLSRLSEIKEGYLFTVVGLPDWDKFEHLDFGYMMKLNTHIFLSSFVDYEDPDVKIFVTSFRDRYFSEPQEFAFSGFDAGMFFLDLLMRSGNKILPAMNKSNIPLIHAKFRFEKLENGGYDNMFWNIVRLQDYKMVPVTLD